MPKTTEQLDADLAQVANAAIEAEKLKQQAISLGQQAHSSKQRAAVEAYLFWREASQEAGYLERLYAENGIPTRQTKGNSVNFNPLIKLVYGKLAKDKGDGWTSGMAHSLNAIDAEFCERTQVYRSDPKNLLFNWVSDNGGLSGVRRKVPNLDDEVPPVPTPKKTKEPTPRGKYRSPDTETHRAILKQHQDQLVSSAGTLLPIGDVPASKDSNAMTDLVVLLARKDENGQIVFIGSSNDTALVDSAVTLCVRFDHNNLSPILATIVEALRPHCVPRDFVILNNRKRFFSAHDVVVDDDGKTQNRLEAARLVIQPDGSIIISKVYSKSGLVTISKAKKVSLASDERLFIRGTDRWHIENNLLVDGQISLFAAEPKDRLGEVDDSKVSDWKFQPSKSLTLKPVDAAISNIKGKPPSPRVVYFHPYEQTSHSQPTIKNPTKITYDWTIEATGSFFHRFFARGISSWVSLLKNGLGRVDNRAFELVFNHDEIEVRSNWWKDKGIWDRTKAVDEECATPFARDASIKFHQTDAAPASITINAHDLLELSNCLATFKLKSKVKIQGTNELLHFSWQTELASHEAWIPSSNLQGHRSSKHFETL
jgi:hypothetical protein